MSYNVLRLVRFILDETKLNCIPAYKIKKKKHNFLNPYKI